MIQAGQDNVALTSYIQGIKTAIYTQITPGQAAHRSGPTFRYSPLSDGSALTGEDIASKEEQQ